MRRISCVVAAAALLAGGCGGGGGGPRSSGTPASGTGGGAPARPVAIQVRDALRGALRPRGAQLQPLPTQLPNRFALAVRRLPPPYTAVRACGGPRAGGAGAYSCSTRPRGADGVSSVTVDVTPAGVWAVRQMTVHVTVHGRRVTAAQGFWGMGIRLPR